MNQKHSLSFQKQKLSEDSSWTERFQEALSLHQQGVSGDKRSVQEASRLLAQLNTLVPGNNLVLAYYGSSLCLLGRDLEDPVERSASVIRGLKFLDQAVVTEPDNFEIRIMRGNIGINLPEMYFHRNHTAVEDFKYLIGCYERYPDLVPTELYFQFLYSLSIAYGNLGEKEASETFLKRLCHESHDPKYKALLAPNANNGKPASDNFGFLLQPLPVILEEAEKYHQAALTGGKTAVQKAIDFLAKAQVLHPEDPLLKVYHADCLSLKGRISANTGEMFANAIKALKIMDTAVVNNPDDLRIRYIRAQQSMRLPELFFARTATAITDLEYLTHRINQDPKLFTIEQTEEILFDLGLCYLRLRLNTEGEAIWRQLLQRTSNEKMRTKISNHRSNLLSPEYNPNLSLIPDPAEFYAQARRLHYLGVSGNQAAAKAALELWEKAFDIYPADPVAQGFYGSSLALIGREAAEINSMFGNAIKGLKHLNEALNRDSDNWELRLLRGYLAYSLPEVFFHTTHQAIRDFQYLKNAHELNPALFSEKLYEEIVMDLQSAEERIGISS